jgi:hypothetical protein
MVAYGGQVVPEVVASLSSIPAAFFAHYNTSSVSSMTTSSWQAEAQVEAHLAGLDHLAGELQVRQ